MEDLSEDEINFMGAGRNDAAVHEGGGNSRQGSADNNGIQRRRLREN